MAAFTVLPFSPTNLFQSLGNDVFGPDAVADHIRARYLSQYLQDIIAQTIVVENDYTDADYLDDFASYYVKCFHAYKRRCKRLHFFARLFDEQTFRKFVRGDLSDAEARAFKGDYLGFVVARPLPDAIIGRTALKTYESDGGRRHYPCTREYRPNLFGMDMCVRSLAFQEQDSVLAACATVALWSAFHKTGELFGTPIPTPVEITRVANEIDLPARPVPSHGLNIEQICNSIRHVGLEPEVVQIRPNTPVVSLIYGHLRMGLPVLLLAYIDGTSGHAVTLAGYSLKNHQVQATEVAPGQPCIPLMGLRIDKFYGHDDQFGPFGRFHVKPSAVHNGIAYPVVFHGSWTDPTTNQPRNLFPSVIVVPVYHKIRVTFLDALEWLTRLNGLLGMLQPLAGTTLITEWDLYLMKTNEYKAYLKLSGMGKTRLEELLLFHHPRFIWHAALSVNGLLALEMLIDATDMARSFPVYYAIWREPAVYTAISSLLNDPAHQVVLPKMLTPRFFDLLKNAFPP
jgi:hypothetical protein